LYGLAARSSALTGFFAGWGVGGRVNDKALGRFVGEDSMAGSQHAVLGSRIATLADA